MVPVAFMVFVREDVLDHAIWTVAVVCHLVVTDHLRHHSLEFVSVETPVMHFRLWLLLFLSHQQVDALGEILVVLEVDLAVQAGGSGGAQGVSGGPRGTSGSSKKANLCGDGGLVSYPPSFSGVISWG